MQAIFQKYLLIIYLTHDTFCVHDGIVQDKTEEPSVKSAAAFRNAGFYEIKDFWIRPSHLCLVCGMRTISRAVEHLFCV